LSPSAEILSPATARGAIRQPRGLRGTPTSRGIEFAAPLRDKGFKELPMSASIRTARFGIGQVVRHRVFPFRGVIFDIDPEFANTEEWYNAIPEHVRPRRDQPFYHLLAENAETEYVAYVSEQNLLADESGEPVRHPRVAELFMLTSEGYRPKDTPRH
jgi:heat shock protein HspQ